MHISIDVYAFVRLYVCLDVSMTKKVLLERDMFDKHFVFFFTLTLYVHVCMRWLSLA